MPDIIAQFKKKTWIFSTDLLERAQYQIAWRSVQWEPR
jgi:hypothetical protein